MVMEFKTPVEPFDVLVDAAAQADIPPPLINSQTVAGLEYALNCYRNDNKVLRTMLLDARYDLAETHVRLREAQAQLKCTYCINSTKISR